MWYFFTINFEDVVCLYHKLWRTLAFEIFIVQIYHAYSVFKETIKWPCERIWTFEKIINAKYTVLKKQKVVYGCALAHYNRFLLSIILLNDGSRSAVNQITDII